VCAGWGRGEETPGEDPTINGEYAAEYVTGMQGDQSSGYLKVSSCLKHYAAYSQETGRQSFPAMVNERDMEDTYLPAFQAGVEKGNASSMMCSYNAESAGEGIFGSGERTNHRNLPWLVSVCLGHAP
jgi:beta-glucosidase-like glycosyl hydrolase